MTATTLTSARPTAASSRVRAGLVAGALAGLVFAMFEMLAALVLDGPDAFFMPLRMIGGIVLGPSAMDPATSLVVAGAVGLVVHMGLSMAYGVGVALLAHAVPAATRSADTLAMLGAAAGFALWVVNFFLLARVFGWAWFPDGQHVGVQIVAHAGMFGMVLGLLLDRLAFRTAR